MTEGINSNPSFSALPEDWALSSIEEVATIASNLVDPADFQSHPHVAPNHIESNTGVLFEHKTIAEDEVTSSKHLFFPGQVLYSKIRPYLAKAVLIDFEGLCSADMYPLTAHINSRYLHRWIISEKFTNLASQNQGRTVLPKINQKALNKLEIPVPPLNEQRRIVEKIEALTDRSRKARQALDAIPALLDQFRQSVLAAAFRGDLTADWRAANPDVESASALISKAKSDKEIALGKYKEPKPLEIEELPDIPSTWAWSIPQTLSAHDSNSICAGPFGTIFKAKDFRDEGVPIIFLRHVAPGEYLTHKPGFMDQGKWEKLFQPYSVYGGELLITKLGDPPGTCAIYPEDLGPAMVTPDVIKMSNNSEITESLYLMHYFNSELSKKIAFGVAYGVTRLRMNLTIFRSLPVPVAPLAEQQEICKQIQNIFASISLVEEQYLSNCSQLSELDQSILAKAFRGQLVPQDPTDEPASHLLDRIRTEREAAAAAAKAAKAARKKQPTKQKTKRPPRKPTA